MHKELIHLLEARAHIIGVRCQHGIQDWSGRRVLSLLDKMSDALVWERARVHDFVCWFNCVLARGWDCFTIFTITVAGFFLGAILVMGPVDYMRRKGIR